MSVVKRRLDDAADPTPSARAIPGSGVRAADRHRARERDCDRQPTRKTFPLRQAHVVLLLRTLGGVCGSAEVSRRAVRSSTEQRSCHGRTSGRRRWQQSESPRVTKRFGPR